MYFLLSFFFVLFSCQKKKSTLAESKNLDQYDTAKNVIISFTINDIPSSEIKTNLLVRELKTDTAKYVKMYNGVHIDVFDKEMNIVNTVDSKKGMYDEIKKIVILQDSVVVKNNKNEMLQTNELSWADSSHLFTTTQKVDITTPQQQIHGWGLKADESFEHYTVYEITGIIAVDKKNIPKQ